MDRRRSGRTGLAHDQTGRPAAVRGKPQETHGPRRARPATAAAGVEPPGGRDDLAAGAARSGAGSIVAGRAPLKVGRPVRFAALIAVVVLAHVVAMDRLSDALDVPLIKQMTTPMFTRVL